MNISVCIITKNASKYLDKCLSSIKKYGFEIIVVDTGSSDNTVAIAEKYADKTGYFEWCNDFSIARNYSISMASNDNILVIDSDECIEELDKDKLFEMITEKPEIAGRTEIVNVYSLNGGMAEGHERICRIFNRKYHEYRGRVHEQVVRRDGKETVYENVPLKILHYGYDGNRSEKRAKSERNIELLLMDIKENGEEPYTLYQLGKSYYMQENYEKACEYFEKGLWFDLNPKLEYVQDMVETYGYALLSCKRYTDALNLSGVYNDFSTSADYVFLMGLIYMNNSLFDEAIEEFNKAATYKNCKVEGCNSYKALYNAGVICECLGRKKEAVNYYEKCGGYEAALEGIRRINA